MADTELKYNPDNMNDYSFCFVGPVIYEYVSWILNEAQRRGLKRLYFLARDGYLLREVAIRICKACDLDIDCRYLYCSRRSLRTPSYHLIGDEAYDLIFCFGYYVTPRSILQRVGLSESEQNNILNQAGIASDIPLSHSEFDAFKDYLKNNRDFTNHIVEISKVEYPLAISYFEQNGLFENDYVAIVDSGWTGSMQRSLRQLMRSAGYCGKFWGFYFGMYSEKKEDDDGEYLTYYFSSKNGLKNKLMFNNNLFECMLSAPHPMTVKYICCDGIMEPIFAEENGEEMNHLIRLQIDGVLQYTDNMCQRKQAPFDLRESNKRCYRLLKRSMIHPRVQEAELYSAFMFCDDITEGYHISMADKGMRKLLSNYLLIPRIFRKLFKLKKKKTQNLLWVYGVIAFCPAVLRPWYRCNVLAYDLLKAVL